MTEHTPGPWRAVPTTGYVWHIVSDADEGQHMFAQVLGSPTHAPANARLIAAAPKLLAAAQRLLAVTGDGPGDTRGEKEYALAIAITEALGR